MRSIPTSICMLNIITQCNCRCSEDYSIPIEQDFKLEFCFLAKDEGSGDGEQTRYVILNGFIVSI